MNTRELASPLHPVVDRVVAVTVVLLAVTTVVVLASVVPDPRGHGTHEQLGLQPCGWPSTLGKPCPTCGVTTAATLVVHLAPLRAVATQPFGAVLALAGIGVAVWAMFALITRRGFVAGLARLPFGRILLGAMILFFGSWAYTYWTFVP